jgi:hypothetical protein
MPSWASLVGHASAGIRPLGQSLSGRNLAVLDRFAILELARQAKADTRLEFDTRASAWLRFLPIPCIDGGVRHRCHTCVTSWESLVLHRNRCAAHSACCQPVRYLLQVSLSGERSSQPDSLKHARSKSQGKLTRSSESRSLYGSRGPRREACDWLPHR